MSPQEILAFLKGNLNDITVEQEKLLEVLYRKALVTRDVATLEYHLNDRGERFMKYLDANT